MSTIVGRPKEKVPIPLENMQRYWIKKYLKDTELATSQTCLLNLYVGKEGGQWNDYHIVAPALLIVRNICEFCSHIAYFQSLFLDVFFF